MAGREGGPTLPGFTVDKQGKGGRGVWVEIQHSSWLHCGQTRKRVAGDATLPGFTVGKQRIGRGWGVGGLSNEIDHISNNVYLRCLLCSSLLCCGKPGGGWGWGQKGQLVVANGTFDNVIKMTQYQLVEHILIKLESGKKGEGWWFHSETHFMSNFVHFGVGVGSGNETYDVYIH